MAKKKATAEAVSEPDGRSTLRRCIGSVRYGLEAHDAPIEDFPAQPSQKDGLGRMCKTHWRQYTAGLARDAKARTTAAADGTAPSEVTTDVEPAEPETSAPTTKRGKRAAAPGRVADAADDAV